jgi:hypothetical protein
MCVSPLLHECSNSKPEAVGQGEVVLEDQSRVVARIGSGPLVRREPGDDPDGDGDQDVRKQNVKPNLQC